MNNIFSKRTWKSLESRLRTNGERLRHKRIPQRVKSAAIIICPAQAHKRGFYNWGMRRFFLCATCAASPPAAAAETISTITLIMRGTRLQGNPRLGQQLKRNWARRLVRPEFKRVAFKKAWDCRPSLQKINIWLARTAGQAWQGNGQGFQDA